MHDILFCEMEFIKNMPWWAPSPIITGEEMSVNDNDYLTVCVAPRRSTVCHFDCHDSDNMLSVS